MKTKPRKSSTDSIIGQNLRAIRVSKGLTQKNLAEALGLTFQQVQKYEKGSNRISASTLLKVADYVDEPLSSFFTGTQPALNNKIENPENINREFYELFAIFQKIPDKDVKKSLKTLLYRMTENIDEDQNA